MIERSGGNTARTGRVIGSLLLAVFAACASADRTGPVARPVGSGLAEYLLSPLEGYPLAVEPSQREELDRAYRAMVERGETEVARTAARAMLGALGEEFTPATVLLGQAAFVAGAPADAQRLAEAAVERHPEYDAALLLLGRSAELNDAPVVAYDAYRRITGNPAGSRRAAAVRDAAFQTLLSDVEAELARRRLDVARELRARLRDWDPLAPVTLQADLGIAVAEGDQVGELEALRRLADVSGPGRDQLERLAELESEIGDSESAVELYQELVDRFPTDRSLEAGLAAAQFNWRVEMLPSEVAQLTQSSELTRGDFATLLYWVLPGVRSGRARGATIVTDVPAEHPQREAVVRVVNLGLVPLDNPELHRFSPDRPITRQQALSVLLGWAGRAQPAPACLGEILRNPLPSSQATCTAASQCGLIEPEAECLPGSVLEGREARNMLRRALDLQAAAQ